MQQKLYLTEIWRPIIIGQDGKRIEDPKQLFQKLKTEQTLGRLEDSESLFWLRHTDRACRSEEWLAVRMEAMSQKYSLCTIKYWIVSDWIFEHYGSCEYYGSLEMRKTNGDRVLSEGFMEQVWFMQMPSAFWFFC